MRRPPRYESDLRNLTALSFLATKVATHVDYTVFPKLEQTREVCKEKDKRLAAAVSGMAQLEAQLARMQEAKVRSCFRVVITV